MAAGIIKSWFRSVWPQRKVVKYDPLGAGIPADVEAQINRQLGAMDRQRRFSRPDRLHPQALNGPALPTSINDDLARDLPRMMAECAHAYATNPIFEGVCNTYTQDVVGPNGPTLQIVCDDAIFAERVEEAWKIVFNRPDPTGRMSGVENAKMWVRLLLNAGSFLNINRSVPRGRGLPDFGWSTIHPRRLVTPMEFIGDEDVAFGVKMDRIGRPETYYLDRPQRFGGNTLLGNSYQQFPAEMVQHRYFAVEPEQLQGYPMMNSTLRTLEEIVELDGATIEAAQSAAHHAWWLHSSDPKKVIDPDPIGSDTYQLQRGAVNIAPIGWTPTGLPASQPNPEAIQYRNLRLAELGRPINMPLLIVLLSVNEATFSSAQFAGSLYRDGIRGVQVYLERETLNELLEQVITDLVIRGEVKRPRKYQKVWTHNVPPYANIEKFVGALEKMVSNGWISSAEASALLGYDWDQVVAGRKRCQEDLEAAELPLPPVNVGNPPKPEPVEAEALAAPAAGPKKPKPGAKRRRRLSRVGN